MNCPKCLAVLRQTGLTGSGHTIYLCTGCLKTFEIKEVTDD